MGMTETVSIPPKGQPLRLTMRLSQERILLAAADPQGKRKLVSETFPLNRAISAAANLRELLSRSNLLGGGFKQVQVLLATDPMLVPLSEFQDEDMPTLYHSSFSGHQGDELVSNVLPDLNAAVVFPVNKDLKGVLEELFDEVTFMPLAQPVWQHLYRRNFSTPRRKLFAYFHDHRVEVFSYAKGRMMFCNNFDAAQQSDALYFLLYAWRQMGYHGEDDELLMVGDVPDREWLAEKLRQYVRRFTILNPAVEFGASSASLDHQLPYDIKIIFLGR